MGSTCIGQIKERTEDCFVRSDEGGMRQRVRVRLELMHEVSSAKLRCASQASTTSSFAVTSLHLKGE